MPRKSVIAEIAVLLCAGDAAAQTWTTEGDYPAKALREKREGTVHFSVLVGSDGKGKSCSVTQSSGSPDLDAASCEMVMRRGRWTPATDTQGIPVEATFSSKFVWKIPR